MSAIFEMPIPSETLEPEEIEKISGCSQKAAQVAWLKQHDWVFFKNNAGMPIIGRLYARLKLAGINPASLAGPESSGWQLDVSNIR
jgi:hypothetical protein